MWAVIYSSGATRALHRHGNMAARITRAVEELAEGHPARMAQVKHLVGSTNYRLRVGDFPSRLSL